MVVSAVRALCMVATVPHAHRRVAPHTSNGTRAHTPLMQHLQILTHSTMLYIARAWSLKKELCNLPC